MASEETPSFSGRLLGSGSWAAAAKQESSNSREIRKVDGIITGH
jgi:hypothetical protein